MSLLTAHLNDVTHEEFPHRSLSHPDGTPETRLSSQPLALTAGFYFPPQKNYQHSQERKTGSDHEPELKRSEQFSDFYLSATEDEDHQLITVSDSFNLFTRGNEGKHCGCVSFLMLTFLHFFSFFFLFLD